ncbi:TPR domain protein [Myxococcus hansupus]|uniref:TPR domain protein n=1 Tax=Pseudomyxococcus hansupus TaxID=1297742 RepID=A0A0H4XNL5_9BACT|nr:TPR domain protein [Myxococcus hansupus]
MALLGAGIVAGGTGAAFGLSSRGKIADAREAPFYDQFVDHHGQAQRSARTANVLFGTAAGAAVGALVTWLLLGETDAAASQEGGAR